MSKYACHRTRVSTWTLQINASFRFEKHWWRHLAKSDIANAELVASAMPHPLLPSGFYRIKLPRQMIWRKPQPCAAGANDPWWRNRWCCRDMLWPTICAWEVVRRHCWISGKARRSCLRWLELACRWQCYSPAQTDVVETQKGLIGNLILLPQASPLRIFVRNVLPNSWRMFFVPCDTLADLRIQPWKGLGMVAEYPRLFQHTFWNIHPPKPDPQQAIEGFLA